MSEFIIGFLIFFIIAQNIYWARVCYNLINRIMAKDYNEFKVLEKKPMIKVQLPMPDDGMDAYAEKQAQELNSLVGVG